MTSGSAFSYTCTCCGQRHEGLPALAYAAPAYWSDAQATTDPEGNRLDSDLCIVGGEHHFIRCVLRVPIQGTDATLEWGVWLSQSKANFDLYAETFGNTPEREAFGYLAHRLPSYPDTLNMRALAHWQSGGQRPWVELEPCDHPLYRDWSEGITREQAIAFAEPVLHPRR